MTNSLITSCITLVFILGIAIPLAVYGIKLLKAWIDYLKRH